MKNKLLLVVALAAVASCAVFGGCRDNPKPIDKEVNMIQLKDYETGEFFEWQYASGKLQKPSNNEAGTNIVLTDCVFLVPISEYEKFNAWRRK